MNDTKLTVSDFFADQISNSRRSKHYRYSTVRRLLFVVRNQEQGPSGTPELRTRVRRAGCVEGTRCRSSPVHRNCTEIRRRDRRRRPGEVADVPSGRSLKSAAPADGIGRGESSVAFRVRTNRPPQSRYACSRWDATAPARLTNMLHNNGTHPQAKERDRKVIFLDALTIWVQDRRDDERLQREQFAALDGLGRLCAQRQSLLDNLAQFYSTHSNADAAPGVLAVITMMSDNRDGCCTLSADRIARFL